MVERATSIENTAYHEAGHAAVSAYFELGPNSVTIQRGDDTLGSSTDPGIAMFDYDSRSTRSQTIRQMIMVCYAGLLAEMLFDPNAQAELSQGDETLAWNLLSDVSVRHCSYVGDEVYVAALERLRRKAQKLVRSLWPEIEALAQALLTRKTLSKEEVEGIVHSRWQS